MWNWFSRYVTYYPMIVSHVPLPTVSLEIVTTILTTEWKAIFNIWRWRNTTRYPPVVNNMDLNFSGTDKSRVGSLPGTRGGDRSFCLILQKIWRRNCMAVFPPLFLYQEIVQLGRETVLWLGSVWRYPWWWRVSKFWNGIWHELLMRPVEEFLF